MFVTAAVEIGLGVYVIQEANLRKHWLQKRKGAVQCHFTCAPQSTTPNRADMARFSRSQVMVQVIVKLQGAWLSIHFFGLFMEIYGWLCMLCEENTSIHG